MRRALLALVAATALGGCEVYRPAGYDEIASDANEFAFLPGPGSRRPGGGSEGDEGVGP